MDRRRSQPPRRFDWSDLQRRPSDPRGGRSFQRQQLAEALRGIERGRQRDASHPAAIALEFCGRVALGSLRLEGMQLDECDVVEALVKNGVRGDLRSRTSQLIRNHVAIQLYIELALRRQAPLSAAMVLGWYAALSAGLPLPAPGAMMLDRIDEVCRRVNSPPMQLDSAIQDVAQLYCGLVHDPLVPSHNGVLARLVMRYHLGRCGLPPVVLETSLPNGDDQQAYAALVALLEPRIRRTGK